MGRHAGAAGDPRALAAIFAGGFIGAVARAELDQLLVSPGADSCPWATFAVNVVGASLLGYFTTRLQEELPLSAYRRPFVGTGLCGGLTTFSTLQVELVAMLNAGHLLLAIGYASASIGAGLAAVALATNLVRADVWTP